MINLLDETLGEIKFWGVPADIEFIGSIESGYSCTWEEFKALADIDYDNGYGAQKIASDLIIAFKGGGWLVRREYDGAEGWEYQEYPTIPSKRKAIKSLIVSKSQCGWETLESIHEELNE